MNSITTSGGNTAFETGISLIIITVIAALFPSPNMTVATASALAGDQAVVGLTAIAIVALFVAR